MIQVIDTVTGSPCWFCGDPIGGGYALVEVTEDQWELACVKCDLVLELGMGK